MKRVGWKTLLLPGALTAFFGAIAGLLAGHGEDCHPAWTFLAGARSPGAPCWAAIWRGSAAGDAPERRGAAHPRGGPLRAGEGAGFPADGSWCG